MAFWRGKKDEEILAALARLQSQVERSEAAIAELSRPPAGPLLSDAENGLLERFRMEQELLAHWQGERSSELVQRIRAILAKLRPMEVVDRHKARFGSVNDGGYIFIDDFAQIDTALSFGVEHNAEFDLEMAERGIFVRQFDHTIEAAPANHPNILWTKKRIAPAEGPGCESIESILRVCDKGRTAPNCILKIDIEHDEWPVFDATSGDHLGRFAQISGEFHGFDYLADPARLAMVERVVDKLTEKFAVVHVHSNNHCSITNYLGLTVPYILELTFVNRSLYTVAETDEIFPGPLDAPCDPARPDIYLGAFRY